MNRRNSYIGICFRAYNNDRTLGSSLVSFRFATVSLHNTFVHNSGNQQHKDSQHLNTESKERQCKWDDTLCVFVQKRSEYGCMNPLRLLYNTHDNLPFEWNFIVSLLWHDSCRMQYLVKFMWAWYDEYNFFMSFVGAAPNLLELTVFWAWNWTCSVFHAIKWQFWVELNWSTKVLRHFFFE